MTVIDPATNLIEIAPMLTLTAKEGAAVVENNWIACYPRPVKCVTDNGPEFGFEFQNMLTKNGIVHRPSTARNPRGNAIIERSHQAIGQVLRTIMSTRNPQSLEEGKAVVAETLATAMHACRCSSSHVLKNNSPGALAFHRHMFMDIPSNADILTLQQHRQALVDKRLLKDNASRIKNDYEVGDLAWKRNILGFSDELLPTGSGPCPITQVHANGTVTVRLSNNVLEHINIRRVYPKF